MAIDDYSSAINDEPVSTHFPEKMVLVSVKEYKSLISTIEKLTDVISNLTGAERDENKH